MKKLIALILVLMILCACAPEEIPEEPLIDEPESEAETEEWPKVSIKDSGRFSAEETVFEDGSRIIRILDSDGKRIGADHKKLRFLGETALCQYVGEIDEKVIKLFYDKNGDPYTKEVDTTYYYILDGNGYPVLDIAFEEYYISPGADITLRGISKGGIYDYLEEDGKLVPVYFNEPFEEDWGSGFIYKGYYFNNAGWRRGINKNGEAIYDNIYTGIHFYFGNRFWLWMECENGYLKTLLGDENGNIICDEFESFGWCPFNEEKCIGTASVGKEERGEYAPTFDENGEPMPDGMWFIDKDGNIISERFEYIEFIFDNDNRIPWGQYGYEAMCATAAKVTYENGETKVIDITPYLLDY